MKIVVLDGLPLNPGDVSWGPLEELGELIVYDHDEPDKLAERVADADIVLTNKAYLRQQELPALSNVKMVGVLATGANVLDIPALKTSGIVICNVPAYGVEDVAQQALALLMELARGTALHTHSVKAGEWKKSGWCYWKKTPLCLTGLTLGIVGFGAIGKVMGRYCNALGMKILAWSRSRKATVDYAFEFADLPEIFKNSDVISLHCPLTPETDKIINADSLALLKTGALLINTARGGLVDEAAAAAALKSGKLGGLGTDVLSVEPPEANNPLLKAPNVLITPHMAWATVRARQRIIDITAENIRAFLAGKPQNQL